MLMVRTTRKLHRLIAEGLGNYNHGNKSNNLEYVAYSHNAQHDHDIGVHPGSKMSINRGDIDSELSGRCKTARWYIWKYD